jgi:DNA-binding NarL/FixJ family response regulator
MITICVIEDIPEIQKGLQAIINFDKRFLLLKCFDNAEEAIIQLPELVPNIVIANMQKK